MHIRHFTKIGQSYYSQRCDGLQVQPGYTGQVTQISLCVTRHQLSCRHTGVLSNDGGVKSHYDIAHTPEISLQLSTWGLTFGL